MNRLNVTLTGTTNPYLAPRLPLDGELELFEIGTHAALISAVFRIRDPHTGRLGAPVEVAEPEFSYRHADAVKAGRPQQPDAALDEVADCTCVVSCADDPDTACSLSGRPHVHPDDGSGTFGPCPVHPDAEGDL